MSNFAVPYYLADSLLGAQQSSKVVTGNTLEEEPFKWSILPLRLFKNTDEEDMADSDDSQDTSKSEKTNKSVQPSSEKLKDDFIPQDDAQQSANVKCAATSAKVGTHIPIVPNTENSESQEIVPFPTQWSRKEKATGLEVSPCGSKVTYIGETISETSDNGARSVRSNCAVPPQCGIFYYEVKVVERDGDKGIIGVGFSRANMLYNRLPGWEEGSWGYHGDDGNCFCNSGSGKLFGPTYKSGDVIGCIFNFLDSTASFTKNGVNLGVAFNNITDDTNKLPTLYPTVGLQTYGETLDTNFGQKKFVFDIETYIEEQKQKVWKSIFNSKISHPSQSDNNIIANVQDNTRSEYADDDDVVFNVICNIFYSYLIHNGHAETLKLFRKCLSLGKSYIGQLNSPESMEKPDSVTGNTNYTGNPKSDFGSEIFDDIIILKSIRQLILNGDIDGAIKEINECYPGFFVANRNIEFTLECRRYVEIVLKFTQETNQTNNNYSTTFTKPCENNGNTVFDKENLNECDEWMCYQDQDSDTNIQASPNEYEYLNKIIECGQEIYKKFMLEKNPLVRSSLIRTFSLSSYQNVYDSPLSYLLDTKIRKFIADVVHKSIMVYKGHICISGLELLYRHTQTILKKLVEIGIYSASLINIRKDCMIDENDL